MNKETLNEIKTKVGIKRFLVLLPSINRAEQVHPKLAFHITDDKKTLAQKKFIETKIENLKIMNPTQWQKYVYKRLSKKDKEKVKEKLQEQLQKREKN